MLVNDVKRLDRRLPFFAFAAGILAFSTFGKAYAGDVLPWNHIYNLKRKSITSFSCAPSANCFDQLTGFASGTEITRATLPGAQSHLSEQGTLIRTVGKKGTLSILAIHGLYGNSTQFNDELDQAQSIGISSISVTLPGHGPFARDYDNVKFSDWQAVARKGLEIAHALGDRVIIMGQSTGGLLAYEMNLEDKSNAIAGLILIEPAFRVQGPLREAVCGFKDIIPTAQDMAWLASIFGFNGTGKIEQPISLSMGCEVARLGNSLLNTYVPPSGETLNQRYLKFFSKNKIPPTIVGHTSTDDIVDDAVIKLLIQAQSSAITEYDESQIENKNVRHGYTQIELTTPQKEGAPHSYETDKLGKYFDSVFPDLKAQFAQTETDNSILSIYADFLVSRDKFVASMEKAIAGLNDSRPEVLLSVMSEIDRLTDDNGYYESAQWAVVKNSLEAKVCRAINTDIPQACEFGFAGTPENMRLSRLISALGRVSSIEAAKATQWKCQASELFCDQADRGLIPEVTDVHTQYDLILVTKKLATNLFLNSEATSRFNLVRDYSYVQVKDFTRPDMRILRRAIVQLTTD